MKIVEESIGVLEDYGRIPISFEVRTIFEVRMVSEGLGGVTLVEKPVEIPWIKDYDAEKDEGPIRWTRRWDMSNWGVISAYIGDERVGGCVIAHDTPESYMLEDRKDVAALWDLRVHPDVRRQGIGSRLLGAATEWVNGRACRLMKIETQNINVPACRFYAAHGFTLGAINRFAYPDLPDEVELIWCKGLVENKFAGQREQIRPFS